jgi:cytochrome bd-type quinol oxidase subunit 1
MFIFSTRMGRTSWVVYQNFSRAEFGEQQVNFLYSSIFSILVLFSLYTFNLCLF